MSPRAPSQRFRFLGNAALAVPITLTTYGASTPDVPYGSTARELECSAKGTLYWGTVPQGKYYVRIDLINRNTNLATRVSVADWRVKF